MGPSRTPGYGVFKNIFELRPGHFLIFDRAGIRRDRYWFLESRPHLDDLATTAEKLGSILQDTVVRQLVSDVPIATLLSGGLDSSAITSIAAKAVKEERGEPLRTFSVDYVGNDQYFSPSSFQPNSDAPWIKIVSQHVGTRHLTIMVDNKKLAEALVPAMRFNDMPGMADIDSSLYLFCQAMKEHITVGLSGECADEILGGYPWFKEDVLKMDGFPWIREAQTKTRFLSPETIAIIKPEEHCRRKTR
jgi:asparagine synthase (glutamine-hydrolysing)